MYTIEELPEALRQAMSNAKTRQVGGVADFDEVFTTCNLTVDV